MSWFKQIEEILNITDPYLLKMHLPRTIFIYNLLSKKFKFELVSVDAEYNFSEHNISPGDMNSKIRIIDIDNPNYINSVSVYENHLYFTYFIQVLIYDEINNELNKLLQQMENEIQKLNTYFLDNDTIIIPDYNDRINIYDMYLKDNLKIEQSLIDSWCKDYSPEQGPNNICQYEIYNACIDKINRLYNIFNPKPKLDDTKKTFNQMKNQIFSILSEYNTKEKVNNLLDHLKDVLTLDKSYNL